MANESGFVIKIKIDDLFIRQASNSGANIVAAYDEAVKLRQKILDAFADVPVASKVAEPVGMMRRAKDNDAVEVVEVVETSEDGPTPGLALPSHPGRATRAAAKE